MGRHSRLVLASRVVHGLIISLVFPWCIAATYLGAWEAKANGLTLPRLQRSAWKASSSFCARKRPLAPLLRRLGDETPFEPFLPPRAAQARDPFLAAVLILGTTVLPAVYMPYETTLAIK